MTARTKQENAVTGESEKARVERHLDNHTKAMSRIEMQLAGMQKTMTDVAIALTKIAALEEHKQESKKDIDNLYALNRKTDTALGKIHTNIAVLQNNTSRNTKWGERAAQWLFLIALAVAQIFGNKP